MHPERIVKKDGHAGLDSTMPFPPETSLLLDRATRSQLWEILRETVEGYIEEVPTANVAPPSVSVHEIRSVAEGFTFSAPQDAADVLRQFARQLMRNQVNTAHPSYFGLFNPAPTTMSVFADAIVAALNPQHAAWSHSPLAVEIEAHLIRSFAAKFGFDCKKSNGTFTTGGAEANQTALLCALAAKWPEIGHHGLQSILDRPAFYLSREGHHSFVKAARVCGLGASALHETKVGTNLKSDTDALRRVIREDREKGLTPFMLVGTAGTTGAGVIDPLQQLAAVAKEEGLWFHVDAAWGGAAAIVPEFRSALDGIERADSITFDSHKWLSVSMGAGMYLTRHPDSLEKVFSLTTSYMPKEGEHLPVFDPYSHSLQWSRRFIGLKLLLSLAVAGWSGYEQVLRHQISMGNLLRARLIQSGWDIVNETPLPLVCFTNRERLRDFATHQDFANRIVSSGKAWISTIQLGENHTPALRACITNYRTDEAHVASLIRCLDTELDRYKPIP